MPSADLTARMYFDQGRQAFARQDYDTAADHFKMAIDSDPLYADAHMYMAESFEKLGYRHRARKAWESLIKITADPKLKKEYQQRLDLV